MPDMPRDPERTRGRYAFTLDGRPAGIDERFVLGDIAPGVWRVRTTRVSARPTSRLESDVRIDVDGTSVAIRWTGSGPGVVRDATAELVERAGLVRGSRTVEGLAHAAIEVPGRVNTLAHVVSGPLMLAAAGAAGAAGAGAAAGVDVVEPAVLAVGDPSAFLAPTALRWTATRTGKETVEVDGEDHEGTAYDWVDSGTGWTARVVVDPGGLILRTRLAAPDGELEVRLTDVDGPWPVPLSWGR
jgi:hypothetical protein